MPVCFFFMSLIGIVCGGVEESIRMLQVVSRTGDNLNETRPFGWILRCWIVVKEER